MSKLIVIGCLQQINSAFYDFLSNKASSVTQHLNCRQTTSISFNGACLSSNLDRKSSYRTTITLTSFIIHNKTNKVNSSSTSPLIHHPLYITPYTSPLIHHPLYITPYTSPLVQHPLNIIP